MIHSRIQNSIPNSRTTNDIPNSRISYSNVSSSTTLSSTTTGTPIGLLLSLTYSADQTTLNPGGFGPYSRITTV